jgi:hypothetical protein
MATANISSTFDITLAGADFNVAKTFTAPRAFTVVAVEATNTAGGPGTLTITNAGANLTAQTDGTAGAGIVQAQAVGGPNMPVGVFAANATVAAGAAIVVTASAVTITKVVLRCTASGGGQTIAIA